jgi:hypothetical protein
LFFMGSSALIEEVADELWKRRCGILGFVGWVRGCLHAWQIGREGREAFEEVVVRERRVDGLQVWRTC